MPKFTDYPRASLRNALTLAEAVYSLGGACAAESAAEKLGKKISGAFAALIGAAVKYGLVSHKKGRLTAEQLFRDYKLAYSPEEQKVIAKRALLSVPLFKNVAERFAGNKLPVEHLDRLLIREFDVPDDLASRIAAYFVEGGKHTGLISDDYLVETGTSIATAETTNTTNFSLVANNSEEKVDAESPIGSSQTLDPGLNSTRSTNSYSVRIQGPGIDSVIVVNDEDDLIIVNTMIKKIQRALATRQSNAEGSASDAKKGEESR